MMGIKACAKENLLIKAMNGVTGFAHPTGSGFEYALSVVGPSRHWR
jgi:hypothetical protein